MRLGQRPGACEWSVEIGYWYWGDEELVMRGLPNAHAASRSSRVEPRKPDDTIPPRWRSRLGVGHLRDPLEAPI